jgi:tRNA 2-thiocytidine biosynthesis protein TtcA
MDFQGKKHLLSYARRAADEFLMIDDGDTIAVGVSGGKDSLTLLCVLAELRRFYPKHFNLQAITIDMGFAEIGSGAPDFDSIAALCKSLDVPFHITRTHMARVIFEERKERSPCSLCSNMRRGIINDTAIKLGCNKVAYGHHNDDLIETFFLNLIHEGRLATFLPVTYLSRRGITVIRPFIYVPEKAIREFATRNKLPVAPPLCPADGHTQRAAVKELLHGLNRSYKGFKHRAFNAVKKAGLLEMREESEK